MPHVLLSRAARRTLISGSAAALAAPALAAAAPVADPPPASPAAYEQLSRASGARGASTIPALRTTRPLFASDLALGGAVGDAPGLFELEQLDTPTLVRSALTNTTRALDPALGELLEADRLEQTGLFRHTAPLEGNPASTLGTRYVVARLDGRGARRDLGVFEPGSRVHLSGNGRFVVTYDKAGLRRLDLRTGTWTLITQFAELGRWSVSDDGQTVAGIGIDLAAQRIDAVVWKGTKATTLKQGFDFRGFGTEPLLSADGATVFLPEPAGTEEAPATTLTAYDAATAKVRATTTLPFEYGAARPLWASPGGDRIAYALDRDVDGAPREPAQVWNVRSGAWSRFGGPFTTSLKAAGPTPGTASVVSRSGRFAVLAYNDQVALANLSGGALPGNPGGREPLSASSYLDTPGIDYCGFGFTSRFSGTFARPASWVKAPRRARITVTDGTKVLADARWTKPAPVGGAGPDDVADGLSVDFPLGTPHTRVVTFTVVDGEGRTLTETYSAKVTCGAA